MGDVSGIFTRALVTVVTMAFALLASAQVATAAPPGMPPTGKVLLGLDGSPTPAEFGTLTQQRHHIWSRSMGWGQGIYWGKRMRDWLAEAEAGNYRMTFHLTTTRDRREQIAPRGIARGYGDAYLLAVSKVVNDSGQIVYIRPMAEMNGHWNVYSAFNRDGSRRNAAHSTRSYRNAFRRIALIMRGGNVATINRALAAYSLPPLRTTAATLPRSGKVALIWNPQGEGAPNVAGNQPPDYYPGWRFVDYVANDLYSIRFRANWRAQNKLYALYPGKPFMMMEWAPWGIDDPAFIDAMYNWVRTHPRTVGLVYFSGNPLSVFRLTTKPRSLARYRARASGSRYACGSCGTFS